MINWMKYRYLYLILSALIIIPGAISLIRFGLNLSVDFTGGSIVRFEKTSQESSTLTDELKNYSPQLITVQDHIQTFRLKEISQTDLDKIVTSLKSQNPDLVVSSFETVGPALGSETIRKTLMAISLATLLLLIHITRAFKQLAFGVCAILAMLHDTLVLVGSFSLLGHFFKIETDLLFVTAMLTVLSFSIHDTIVVYDRIRELKRRHNTASIYDLANTATTQTMIRSLNNSLTVIFMLSSLILLGGETTRGFALALLIGSISGAYSSPFTAVPLLVIWDELARKRS